MHAKNLLADIGPLPDGAYRATCKERSPLAAGINGHFVVYPVSIVTVRNGLATFTKNGEKVWTCNASYAAIHFHIEKIH